MEGGGGGNLLKLLVLLGGYSKSRLTYGTAAEYVTFSTHSGPDLAQAKIIAPAQALKLSSILKDLNLCAFVYRNISSLVLIFVPPTLH